MARLRLATLLSSLMLGSPRAAAGETFSLQAGVLRDGPSRADRHSPANLHFISPPHVGAADGDETVELLDTVLVASVDGRFHAVNRTSGAVQWSMTASAETQVPTRLAPLVRSRSPNIDPADWDPDWDTYVIEPQTGDIYVVPSHTGPEGPLHKLGISVDTLVEFSPFRIAGDKPRTFIGKKETSLLSIDLNTGKITSFVNVADECRWDDEFSAAAADHAALAGWKDADDDRDEPRSRGRSPTVSIGRTDYYVSVVVGGRVIQRLAYSKYGPNNIDNKLQMRWTETPDHLYMQSHPAGHLYAFSTDPNTAPNWQLPEFEQPIAAIFDVVTVQGHADPVALLQPRPRIADLLHGAGSMYSKLGDRTYVGQLNNALYAMSAQNYPLVAFNMQDRRAPRLDEHGEPESGYNSGVWKEDCTKPECMVGRWLTLDVSSDPSRTRFIDAPKPEPSVASFIEAKPTADPVLPGTTTTTTSGGSTSTQITSTSGAGSLVSSDLLPAMWSSPKAYGPVAAFVVAVMLWVVIHRGTSTTHKSSRGLVVEYKPHPQHIEPTSPNATPVPATPAPAPPELPVFKLEPPIVLTAPEPDNQEADQTGDDGVDGDDDDKNEKDDAATPGKKRPRPRKRKRKYKNGGNGDQVAEGSENKDDSKDDEFVVVDELLEEQIALATPTMVLPSTPRAIEPASLVVSDKQLGLGSHGTIVYQGAFQGRAVAVKRLLGNFTTLATREVELLQESDDHPNVIRYFYKEHRDNFLYIALELCPASLSDIIERPNDYVDISCEFDPNRALSQISMGLRHLHSLKIIHRDIKPQNILISHAKNGVRRMLISDFGLCKKLDTDQTSFQPTMHGAMAAGTVGWRAPEILRGDVVLDPTTASDDSQQSRGSSSGYSPVAGPATTAKRLTKSVDVFALGCLFYYTLTSGGHPFGDRFVREFNILKNEFHLGELERQGEPGVEAIDLISKMLDPEPKTRPDTLQILLHPFFWTPGRRLAFLQDASDRFEIMCRDPRDAALVDLETGAAAVVGNDWHSRLDRVFIENLGKFRKYDGRTVQDLLRALRNKKHHYQDMPDNVKRHIGTLPDGFLAYFTKRFPALFMHVHDVVSRTGLSMEPMFRSYFELAES